MSPSANLPVERDTLQTVGGTLLLFTLLIRFTEASARSFAPLLGLFGGMLAYEVADDIYDLPDGTNWTVYGLGLGFAGLFLIFEYVPWAGGLLGAAGAWFVVDGTTKIRYGSETTHEFVSGPEDEAMLKMQVMNTVRRTLDESQEPLTVEELAESCDLTESRVSSALEYMEHRKQVAHVEDGYRVKPQRWGTATPVVRFLTWVPRRLVQPLNRVRR